MLLLLFSGNVSGGGVSGTVAYTNANDTLAASGTTTIVGTLARTNANDTSTASGSPIVNGAVAYANNNDTLAASGSVGSSVSGTVAYTNANDTLSASGTTTVTGTLAKTNANDSLSASGTTTVTGTLARTNANDSVSASGAAGAVTGTVSYTNNNDTATATGAAQGGQTGDVDLNVDYIRKVYLKRGSKYLIFNTPQEADAFEYAEKQANKAIEQAQKTSRRARKRLREKVYAALPDPEVIDTADLLAMANNLRVTIDLQSLIMTQNISQLMQVRDRLMQLQDEEDLEMIMAML